MLLLLYIHLLLQNGLSLRWAAKNQFPHFLLSLPFNF